MNISKTFQLRPILPSEFSKSMDMMTNFFFPHEPLTAAMGVRNMKAIGKYYEPIMHSDLKSGHSRVLIHKETNEWAAANFATIYTKEEYEESRKSEVPEDTVGGKIKQIFLFLSYVEDLYPDLFREGDEKIMARKAVTVDPRFAGYGLAKRLMEESEKIAKQNECSAIMTLLTSIKTQDIMEKMGYDTSVKVNFADFKINGKNIIQPEMIKDTTCLKYGIRRLT